MARKKQLRNPPSDRPFRPLVLSLGGVIETEETALKLWKLIKTGVNSLLFSQLSLAELLGARCFEP
jgi:hypothetical protein